MQLSNSSTGSIHEQCQGFMISGLVIDIGKNELLKFANISETHLVSLQL